MMKKPLCSAADTSLFVETNGKVGLCCAGGYLGNLRKDKLVDIFERDEFKNVQKTLAEGEFPDYCITCKKHEEQAAGAGYFHHINEMYPSSGFRQLQHVDIRWNNVCNLSCRYCDPLSSSQWMKIFGMPMESSKRDYIPEILDEIERNKHTIRGVSLLGGEPFLQTPNERLFEILNKSTRINIVTNLSTDLENNKIYHLLKDFTQVTFSISFENIGDRFEYVRAGATWEQLMKNLMLLRKDKKRFIGCLSVYNIFSALNLAEFYQFSENMQLPIQWQHANYRWEHPYATDSFFVAGHSKEIIDKAISEIDFVAERYKVMKSHSVGASILDNMKNWLAETPVEPGKGSKFLQWVDTSESLIKPKKSFQELWPDLYQMLARN